MKNFPQSFEPVGSDSILEQFIQLKNYVNDALSMFEDNANEIIDSNVFVQTKVQNLTNEQKAQARENIGAGASIINVVDNCDSTSSIDALSANQGRILNEKINQSVQELQNDIDANGGDIAGLQSDVSELNQQMQRTLKTPIVSPTATELVGIDDNNSQVNLSLGDLKIENGVIKVEKSAITAELSNDYSIPAVNTKFNLSLNQVLNVGNKLTFINNKIKILNDVSVIKATAKVVVNSSGAGNLHLYINKNGNTFAVTPQTMVSGVNSVTIPNVLVNAQQGDEIDISLHSAVGGTVQGASYKTYLMVEVVK